MSGSSSPSSELKNVAEVKAVAEANSQFAANLHGILREVHPNNLIYSPFSLSTVIGMVKLGSDGDTSKEIENTFRFPSDNDVLGKGYSQVLTSFQEENEGYVLAAANRLYLQNGFELHEQFSNSVKSSFGAELQQLDFGQNVQAAQEINGWVEKTTRNKIKNLIPADALNALTRVVLVNGIYFKGLWKNKFDPTNTEKSPFFLNESDSVEVDMMYKESKFPFTVLDEIEASCVALPYKGDRLSMIIFVPQNRTGLSKIEEGLKNFSPADVLSRMSSETVQVHLPRFKIESTIQLVEPLKKLGIRSMFSDSADFSRMSSTSGLAVSEVIQKAFIEVNEEGSEAAAATGVVMMLRCMPFTCECRADRPFFFQIVDNSTNFVLFSGSCSNPLE